MCVSIAQAIKEIVGASSVWSVDEELRGNSAAPRQLLEAVAFMCMMAAANAIIHAWIV